MRRPRWSLTAALSVIGGLALLLLVVLPVVALVARAPWGSVLEILGEPANRTALRLSIQVSLWALGLSVVLGFPIAWVLARVPFPAVGSCAPS